MNDPIITYKATVQDLKVEHRHDENVLRIVSFKLVPDPSSTSYPILLKPVFDRVNLEPVYTFLFWVFKDSVAPLLKKYFKKPHNNGYIQVSFLVKIEEFASNTIYREFIVDAYDVENFKHLPGGMFRSNFIWHLRDHLKSFKMGFTDDELSPFPRPRDSSVMIVPPSSITLEYIRLRFTILNRHFTHEPTLPEHGLSTAHLQGGYGLFPKFITIQDEHHQPMTLFNPTFLKEHKTDVVEHLCFFHALEEQCRKVPKLNIIVNRKLINEIYKHLNTPYGTPIRIDQLEPIVLFLKKKWSLKQFGIRVKCIEESFMTFEYGDLEECIELVLHQHHYWTETKTYMKTLLSSRKRRRCDICKAILLKKEHQCKLKQILFGEELAVFNEVFNVSDYLQKAVNYLKLFVDYFYEQQVDFEVHSPRRLLFLAGAAGSGKTTVLKRFEQETSYVLLKVAFTALAADNINGFTIDKILSDVKENKEFIKNIQVLFIDEISMVSYEKLKILSMVFKNIPFIVAGDFDQLPPISLDEYVFHYSLFENGMVYYLDKNLRFLNMSAQEKKFMKQLNEGKCNMDLFKNIFSLDQLVNESELYTYDVLTCPPVLCSTNNECHEINLKLIKNTRHLQYIDDNPKQTIEYHCRRFIESYKIPKEKEKDVFFKCNSSLYNTTFFKKSQFKYIEAIVIWKCVIGQQLRCNQNIYEPGKSKPLFSNGLVYEFIGLNAEGQMECKSKTGEILLMEKTKYTLTLSFEKYKESINLFFFPVSLNNAMTIHKSQGQTFDYPYYIKLSKHHGCENEFVVALTRSTQLNNVRFITNVSTFEDLEKIILSYRFTSHNLMKLIQRAHEIESTGNCLSNMIGNVKTTVFKKMKNTGEYISIFKNEPLEEKSFENVSDKALLSHFSIFYDIETCVTEEFSEVPERWDVPYTRSNRYKAIEAYCIGFIILYHGKFMDPPHQVLQKYPDAMKCRDGVWRILYGSQTFDVFCYMIFSLIEQYYHTLRELYPLKSLKSIKFPNLRKHDLERRIEFSKRYVTPIRMIAHNGLRFDAYFFAKTFLLLSKDMCDLSRKNIFLNLKTVPGNGNVNDIIIDCKFPITYFREENKYSYAHFNILQHWDSVKFSLCALDDVVKNYFSNITTTLMEHYLKELNIHEPILHYFDMVKTSGKGLFPHKATLLDTHFININTNIHVHESYYFSPPSKDHPQYNKNTQCMFINPREECDKYITPDLLILFFLVVVLEYTRLFDEEKTASILRFITVQQKLKNDVYGSNSKIQLREPKVSSEFNGCKKYITNIPKTPQSLAKLFSIYLYGGITLPRVHVTGKKEALPFSTSGYSYEPYLKGDINGMYSYVQSCAYYPCGKIIEIDPMDAWVSNLKRWIKSQEMQIQQGMDWDLVVMKARRDESIPKFFIIEATFTISNSMESPMSFRHDGSLYHGLTLHKTSRQRRVLTDYISIGDLISFEWILEDIHRVFKSEESLPVYQETVENFDRIKAEASPNGLFPNPAKRTSAKLDSNALYGLNLRQNNNIMEQVFQVKNDTEIRHYVEKLNEGYDIKNVNVHKTAQGIFLRIKYDLEDRQHSDFSTTHGYITLKGSHRIINRAMRVGYGKYLIPKTKDEFECAVKHRPLYGDTDSLVMPHCFVKRLWQHDLMILSQTDLTEREKDECCFFFHVGYPFLRHGGKFEDEEKKDNYHENFMDGIFTHIQGFITNAPKSYSLLAVSPNNKIHTVTKIKGIPRNAVFSYGDIHSVFSKDNQHIYEIFWDKYFHKRNISMNFNTEQIVRQGFKPYVNTYNNEGLLVFSEPFDMFSHLLRRSALQETYDEDHEEDHQDHQHHHLRQSRLPIKSPLRYKRMMFYNNILLPIGFNIL